MNMKTTTFIIAISISLCACSSAFFACEQESLDDIIDHCLFNNTELLEDHNILGSSSGMQQWQVLGPDYQHPHFNPNNLNEIAFQKSREIWIIDMCTGEKRLLIPDYVSSLWDWGKTDWLIYTNTGMDLYKIKSNGDSLTRLTTYGIYNTNALFNSTGDKYVYRKIMDAEGFSIIANLDGVHLDTIGGPMRSDRMHWFEDGRLCGRNSEGIGFIDIASFEMTAIDFIYLHFTVYGAHYLYDDASILWGTKQYLFRTNVDTGERAIIKQGSVSQVYREFDVSPDQSTILVIRSDMTPGSPSYIIEERKHLCLMDIDGRHERRMMIDW